MLIDACDRLDDARAPSHVFFFAKVMPLHYGPSRMIGFVDTYPVVVKGLMGFIMQEMGIICLLTSRSPSSSLLVSGYSGMDVLFSNFKK